MTSIFVSLSHLDKDRVSFLCDVFESARPGVLFDAYHRTGRTMPQEFDKVEDERIGKSSAVLLALSTDWFRSRPCYREYVSAMIQGKGDYIIPVKVAAIDQEALSEHQRETYRRLRAKHGGWYDLTDMVVEPDFRPQPDFSIDKKFHGADAIELSTRLSPFSITPSHQNEFQYRKDRFETEARLRTGLKPYKGLQPYLENDESFFFGRDRDISQCIREFDAARSLERANFFLISGPSGAGKSSFLRAGLLSRLRGRPKDYLVLPTLDASKRDIWRELETQFRNINGWQSLPSVADDGLSVAGGAG